MAQQAGNAAFLPNDQWLNSIGQRMQPLNMLKLGYTGPFQYQPLPTAGPGAYSGAANAVGALGGIGGQVGGAAMQYYMQKQLQTTAANNAAINAYSAIAPTNAALVPMSNYNYANGGSATDLSNGWQSTLDAGANGYTGPITSF